MTVTIKEIDGELMTVVWQGGIGGSRVLTSTEIYSAIYKPLDDCLFFAESGDIFAVALPALPRNPKPEDAALIYRYMAEGIYPKGERLGGIQISSGELVERCLDEEHSKNIGLEITHAIDTKTGERVEIAIKD
jgi:hypothetical protein